MAMATISGKQALLRATIEVVAECGLRRLTYRAVAERAGVSHGLVRHHFGTRDQLISQALDYAVQQSLHKTSMLRETITIDEFAAGLESLSKRETTMQSFQYELLLETRRRPELREAAEYYYQCYRQAITRQLLKLGVTDPALADVIWFALDGMVFNQLVLEQDVSEAVERIRTILRRNLNYAGS